VDHPPGAHDDLANACCGALLLTHRQAAIDPDDWVFGEPRFDPDYASLTTDDWRYGLTID
jgi:hypothetical protein